MPDQQQTSLLSALSKTATLQDLQKTAVFLASRNASGQLDLFLCFLIELSLESNQNLLKYLLSKNCSQSQNLQKPVKFIKNMSSENPFVLTNKDLDACISSYRLDKSVVSLLHSLNQHAIMGVTDRGTELLHAVMILAGQWLTRNIEFRIPEGQSEEFDLRKYIKIPKKNKTEVYSSEDVPQRFHQVVTE